MSAKQMVAVIANLLAVEGHVEPMARMLGLLVEQSRQEPGVLQYAVHQEVDDPASFWTYELYEDDFALAAHRARKPLARLGPAFEQALAERPLIRVVNILSSEGLSLGVGPATAE